MIDAKLVVDTYNVNELIKSVDVNVRELIKPLPTPNLDLIPKPLYDEALLQIEDLTQTVATQQIEIDSLNADIIALEDKVRTLEFEIDDNKLQKAFIENQFQQSGLTIIEIRQQIQDSFSKAINENIERGALEAENEGLIAQKNALIKQIDTLNNLLNQQNIQIQRLETQLSAKEQAVAAGGIATGQLSTIVFDAGDPTKNPIEGFNQAQDYGDGYGSQAKYKAFAPPGNALKPLYREWFDIVAGPKDIQVDVSFKDGLKSSPWNFGVSLPATIKANQTLRFKMNSPASYLGTITGQHGGGLFSRSKATEYNYVMTIIVKDTDANGKTETKDFRGKLYHHG
jgi:cell division protein FtsB